MAELVIPERRWADPRRPWDWFARVWLPAFVAIGFIALWVVMAQDPAGFDSCDGTIGPPSPAEKQTQVIAATAAVAMSLALAAWRLRRGALVMAILLTGLSALVWWWLLFGGPPPCDRWA